MYPQNNAIDYGIPGITAPSMMPRPPGTIAPPAPIPSQGPSVGYNPNMGPRIPGNQLGGPGGFKQESMPPVQLTRPPQNPFTSLGALQTNQVRMPGPSPHDMTMGIPGGTDPNNPNSPFYNGGMQPLQPPSMGNPSTMGKPGMPPGGNIGMPQQGNYQMRHRQMPSGFSQGMQQGPQFFAPGKSNMPGGRFNRAM